MGAYKWAFVESGNYVECQPKIEDKTALEFAKETNEQFYRAKLSGSLAFRFEYEDILAQGLNYTHTIALLRYDDDLADYNEIWRGSFVLTDCEIDVDTKTITVAPKTEDKYTAILEHLEDEYNLLALNPTQQACDIMIRPIVQVYSIGSEKITNYTANHGAYEQDVLEADGWIIDNFRDNGNNPHHFYLRNDALPSTACSVWIQRTVGGQTENVYYFGWFSDDTNADYIEIHNAQRYTYNVVTGVKTVTTIDAVFMYYSDTNRDYYFWFDNQGDLPVMVHYESKELGSDIPYDYSIPQDCEFIKSRADAFVARCILNTEEAQIVVDGNILPTYDLDQSTDFAPLKNYNKVCPYPLMSFYAEVELQTLATEWGLGDQEGYFINYNIGNVYLPINLSQWCLHAMWMRNSHALALDEYSLKRTIRHCYTLASAIEQLAKKADINISLPDSATYSEFLFSNDNHITDNAFYLLLTPRTNILSSYYNQPAQNAPVSLSVLFNMLKSMYKVYWYIDSNYNLHFEHISYFDNGLSYTEQAPVTLVDLETTLHTNTKSAKVFGQNKYKYDKQDMPETYTFGFDDTQTKLFDGYDIKSTDVYVQLGQKEEITAAKFDTDIDYLLVAASDVSKEGFVLLACPYVGGVRNFATGTKKVYVKNEYGISDNYWLQNYDCAFAFIHKHWWRYALSCENVIINNLADTAKSTGRHKTQNITFADLAMVEVLKDANNCIKSIRTQQGDGHIKTLSVNLNSLQTTGDLLFDFTTRKYYIKGTALSGTLTITINGTNYDITMTAAGAFVLPYTDKIQSLSFNNKIVSVDFLDTDNLDELTSCDNMFANCDELVAVDFAGKTMAAVTSATNMFAGCTALTTLICPDSSTWQPDIDFSDCPNLTTDSLYDFIKYLYYYNSGMHLITPNTTMWQSLDGAVQDDIIAKAQERGWDIALPASYSISGHSTSSTVYATINGNSVEIPVTAGAFSYGYNTPITSISFENDTNLTDIDFSMSDGLAGLTTLADAFKGCSALTSVVFTNCDLTNVASASDAFATCTALTTLTIPSNTWKPDVDLSATAIAYAEMSNVVSGLYTYTSGTHTITFNSTIWDALSVAQQQTIFDAAQLKWWTTNAVAVVYKIKGTSTAASETFTLNFIDDDTQAITTETITCAVDGSGNFEHEYHGKKIYQMISTFMNNTTITSVEFNEPMDEIVSMGLYPYGAFLGCTNLQSVVFNNNSTFAKLTSFDSAFTDCVSLTAIDLSMSLFPSLTIVRRMFMGCTALTSVAFDGNNTFNTLTNMNNWFTDCTALTSVAFLLNAIFANVTSASTPFQNCTSLTTIDLQSATLVSLNSLAYWFDGASQITTIDLSSATLSSVTNMEYTFRGCTNLTTIYWSSNLNLNNLQSARQSFSGCTNLTNTSISAFTSQTFTSLQLVNGIFTDCKALTAIDLHLPTFANVTTTNNMFNGCTNLTTIDLSNATFASLTTAQYMFANCSKLTTISGIENIAFASVTDASSMFYYCTSLTSLDLSSATFASATSTQNIFRYCSNLVTLNVNIANWSNVTNAGTFMRNCPKLTTFICSVNNGFTKPNSTSGCNITESPLTYQSMLNIANWMPTTTTSRSVTFKATAWNALSTAEQNTIDSILSGKNWTRAIA